MARLGAAAGRFATPEPVPLEEGKEHVQSSCAAPRRSRGGGGSRRDARLPAWSSRHRSPSGGWPEFTTKSGPGRSVSRCRPPPPNARISYKPRAISGRTLTIAASRSPMSPPGREGVRVRLRPGASVRGIVVTEDESPVPEGCNVVLLAGHGGTESLRRVHPTDDGTFEFGPLEPGAYIVFVEGRDKWGTSIRFACVRP